MRRAWLLLLALMVLLAGLAEAQGHDGGRRAGHLRRRRCRAPDRPGRRGRQDAVQAPRGQRLPGGTARARRRRPHRPGRGESCRLARLAGGRHHPGCHVAAGRVCPTDGPGGRGLAAGRRRPRDPRDGVSPESPGDDRGVPPRSRITGADEGGAVGARRHARVRGRPPLLALASPAPESHPRGALPLARPGPGDPGVPDRAGRAFVARRGRRPVHGPGRAGDRGRCTSTSSTCSSCFPGPGARRPALRRRSRCLSGSSRMEPSRSFRSWSSSRS